MAWKRSSVRPRSGPLDWFHAPFGADWLHAPFGADWLHAPGALTGFTRSDLGTLRGACVRACVPHSPNDAMLRSHDCVEWQVRLSSAE